MEVGVAKGSTRKEPLSSCAIALFPSDSVLAALQVMHQHGLAVLPVVDGERGELLGEVTEVELCCVASRLPLILLAEVLTAKALGGQEGMTGEPEPMWEPASESPPRWLH